MLKTLIEQQFTQAFTQLFPNVDFTQHPIEVTQSTHERFGHYQCNSAMKFTKLLQKPPRDIANVVMEAMKAQDTANRIAQLEIAGPGFINVTLNTAFINQQAQQLAALENSVEKAAKPQKIVIDFSSPNTAKEMHVGHLRSTIIGDSLARLFEAQGHDVLRLNHVGDWGTAFGMLIAYLKQERPKILTGEETADLTVLVDCYRKSKAKFDEDAAFKKASQLEVVELQGGDPQALKAWDIICDISRKAYQEIYDLLDIRLNERGESFYKPFLPGVIADLESKNMVTMSDGAKCIFLDGFVNREGEPLPMILVKTDGGFNYSTTDIAAIRHRIQDEKADRIIYVVDAGQATHFSMIFAAAKKAGYLDPAKVRADHVAFGLVLGPDGKKFKTRSGETERLIDLLTNAIARAQAILEERDAQTEAKLGDREIKHIAHVLGINAVKYSDLSCNRTHDYAFSYDRMLRFEGNTAAFLMYAFVRIHGIKRKIKDPVLAPIKLEHTSEVALGLHLVQFNELLASVSDDLMPNRLCEYLFVLAEKFNGFFRDCRVEGTPEQAQRLALCELTERVLQEGLTILGLKTVTKM